MSNTSTLIMLTSPAPGPLEPVPRSPPLTVALRCCPLPCQMGLVLRGGRPGLFGRGLVSSWRSAEGQLPLLSKGECKNLSTLAYRQEYTKNSSFFKSYSSFFLSPHFILFSVNIISTGLPEKWPTLILCCGTISLTLNCLRIQRRDYTKRHTG